MNSGGMSEVTDALDLLGDNKLFFGTGFSVPHLLL